MNFVLKISETFVFFAQFLLVYCAFLTLVKYHEKINVIFVMLAIMASFNNFHVSFQDEKLTPDSR